MADWRMANPEYLFLLVLLPVLAVLIWSYLKWRRNVQSQFSSSRFFNRFFPETNHGSPLVPYLFLTVFLLIIVALSNIVGGKELEKNRQRVQSVMFVLDISNSMNAQDVSSSRLARARNIVSQTLDAMAAHRVGLVVFAGEARSVMPLTSDYIAAESYVQAIESEVIKRQGTDFLKAVEESVKKFKSVPKGARHIVLLSDGEDNEGNANEALALAKKEGIKITSVGIGSDEGAPVPEFLFGQLMGYKVDRSGSTVFSSRETQALQGIASGTGGNYIDGNNLEYAAELLVQEIQNSKGGASLWVENQNSIRYYQFFVGGAILILLVIFVAFPKNPLNY